MNIKDDGESEKIVPICVFCRKYNISNKRAMSIGIDNSNIEMMSEQEFEKILLLCEEMGKQEKVTAVIPEIKDISILNHSATEATEFNIKSRLNSLRPEVFGLYEYSKYGSKRLKLNNGVYSNLENKLQWNDTLLYSDITLSEVHFELLESSVPPNNNKSDINFLNSEDVEEQEGVARTLLYTSEL